MGAACASLQLHRDEPEQPAADILQGLLRLPVHGGQDLGEGPEEQQPQAQELKREAVVVRIVPDMVASSIQESLHPPKQAPGQVEKASCQPERPAQCLPKEGGGDTWRAAFWRADGRHCARALRGSVPPRGFLLLPCPFLLRKTAKQEHLVQEYQRLPPSQQAKPGELTGVAPTLVLKVAATHFKGGQIYHKCTSFPNMHALWPAYLLVLLYST